VKRALFSEAYAYLGMEAPRTAPSSRHPAGQVQTDQAALDFLVDNDADGPRFRWLSQYNQAQKFKSAYLAPILEAGALGLPLHHSLNVLVDSGRTSARGPNVQNFPAFVKKKEEGRALNGPMIRGSFVPRPGYVFIAADYEAIELAGLAQVMSNMAGELGTMARIINEGKDCHLYLAAQMMKMSYEDVVAAYNKGKCPEPRADIADLDDVMQAAERAHHAGRVSLWKQVKKRRQFAKVVNYGAPGGCSPRTLAQQAKQQGVEMTVQEAKETLLFWKQVFSETNIYFDTIRRLQDPVTGMFCCEQHGPNRTQQGWRRRLTDRYTSASNTFFQGICADGAKAAGWQIALGCYAKADSPLAGCAMVLFLHDEFVVECPAEKAEEGLAELQRCMVAGMKTFIPDVRVATAGTIYTDRWSK
jgi:DNA polymerase I-like protein with 3'-5' exonuclease and polymerase domains